MDHVGKVGSSKPGSHSALFGVSTKDAAEMTIVGGLLIRGIEAAPCAGACENVAASCDSNVENGCHEDWACYDFVVGEPFELTW